MKKSKKLSVPEMHVTHSTDKDGTKMDYVRCESCKGKGCAGCRGLGFYKQIPLALSNTVTQIPDKRA